MIKETPFVDGFLTLGATWAAIIVGIGSLLSMITSVFTILIGLPRILYQMAKDVSLLYSFIIFVVFIVFLKINRDY